MADDALRGDVPQLGIVADASRVQAEAKARTVKHPKGWEPGVAFDGESGIISTGPRSAAAPPSADDWLDLLAVWNLDPEKYEIDPDYNPEFRAWDANVGGGAIERLYYYKAKIRLRGVRYGLDVDEILDGIRKWKRLKSLHPAGPQSLVVPLSDWQIGKGDGDGVRGTVDRIMTSFDRLEDVIDDLKRSKVGLECVYLMGLGDLIEQCTGNYPAQAFTTELNRREQLRLTFRCLRDGTARIARRVDRMVLGGVAGNHGENRLDGKAFTTPGDNDDLLVIEMVANALMENDEAFGHVSFVIPEEKLWVVLDISGVSVGFTHGHQAGRGSTPQEKQKQWLKDMAFGEHDIGSAKIVVTGHYHHLSVIDHGPKVHIQCPAMDGGSQWWINKTGSDSSPGTACFVVSSEYRMGFDHLRVV